MSDDYFDDNLVLDADAVAALDEAERKYDESQRQSQRRPSAPPTPPPPKRQKLGEKSVLPRPASSVRRLESLPEISVHGDGSYGLGVKRPNVNNTNTVAAATNAPRTGSFRVAPVSRNAPLVSSAAQTHNNRQARLGAPPQSGFTGGWSSRPPSQQVATNNASQNSPAIQATVQSSEVERLRVQLQELAQAQEQTQKSLKEAQDARMMKEGEVSILRKAAKKAEEEHQANIGKINAAKEAAEAMQQEMQKNMKEEIDRMRTEFTFRQHELETAVRKTPKTVRPRKIANVPPPTPVPMPSQIRKWSDYPVNLGSPSRTRHPESDFIDTSRYQQPIVEKPKKPLGLPGFVNAFEATPQRAQVVKGKGKGKEREGTYARVPSETSIFADKSFADRPVRWSPSPPSSPSFAPPPEIEMEDAGGAGGFGKETDVAMVDESAEEGPAEELEVLPPPDWTEEFHRVVFTHKVASLKTLTLQTLINTPLSSPSSEQQQAWSMQCSRLLECMGVMSSKVGDKQRAHGAVAAGLVELADMLQRSTMIPLLTALLNMLRVLIIRVQFLPDVLLSANDTNAEPTPHVLLVLCNIIRTHLAPKKEAMNNEAVLLAQETLGVLESLTWNISDAFALRVAQVVKVPGVLSTLLSSLQPVWILQRAARVMAILASYPHLFRVLLSFPDPEPPDKVEMRDLKRIPHIEQLALHLVDTTRDNPEVAALKEMILTFIASLIIADMEALAILAESETLIPAIMIYLCETASPIFEEDEQVMSSSTLTETLVMKTCQTVSLLYRLVFCGIHTSFQLRHKLLANARPYHGALNMFIVTAGRLTYADFPLCIDGALRRMLERSRDMAEDMLNFVVDGPEIETIWYAFNFEQEIISREEQDEMEARRLHASEPIIG